MCRVQHISYVTFYILFILKRLRSSYLSFELVIFDILVFLFSKMLFMIRLEFSSFADFFVWIIEPRVEFGFL
jgi:hypothetical protein